MSASSKSLTERIVANPIIAAIRRDEDVEAALGAPVGVVFLLNADIFNLAGLTERFRSAGKEILVHVDFLEGIGRDAKAVRYLAEVIRPSGILTTRSQHVKVAKEYGLFVIQRFFLIDHQSYEMAVRTVHSVHPDMVELMPALMPAVIERFCSAVAAPVIAGGLISSKDEIVEILKAGALGASTGNPLLWNL